MKYTLNINIEPEQELTLTLNFANGQVTETAIEGSTCTAIDATSEWDKYSAIAREFVGWMVNDMTIKHHLKHKAKSGTKYLGCALIARVELKKAFELFSTNVKYLFYKDREKIASMIKFKNAPEFVQMKVDNWNRDVFIIDKEWLDPKKHDLQEV